MGLHFYSIPSAPISIVLYPADCLMTLIALVVECGDLGIAWFGLGHIVVSRAGPLQSVGGGVPVKGVGR